MDRSEVIYLVSEIFSVNQYGVQEALTNEKMVYCQVDSVTGSEWFEGGRNGLNPELRLTMFKYDYSGEKIVKYNGIYYSIYRTYLAKNDMIELYVERRVGSDIEVPEPDPEPDPEPTPDPIPDLEEEEGE